MKIFLILFFFPLFIYSQKKDTVVKYLDENLDVTSEKNAFYFGVAVKQNNYWHLYVVYPDTTPVLKAYYKDKALKIKEGPYIVFYPKNIIALQTYYFNNKMNGVRKTWYTNGQLKDSGQVIDNRVSGLWQEWHENGTLKSTFSFKENLSGTEKIILELNDDPTKGLPYTNLRTGEYSTFYKNGKLESTGRYENDIMVGEWKWYHETGALSTIEEYKNGLLNKIKCFDATGKETGDFCSVLKPAYLKDFGNYKEFIYQNLLWPEEAIKNKIQGDVVINFMIDKKGQLKNLEINTPHPVLKKAVEDLFQQMQSWSPAVSHNRPIEWKEEFVIPFYLKK